MGKQGSFIQAVKYALAGIQSGFKSERNMRRDFWLAHVILGIEIVLRPALSAVSATLMAISLVLSAELFNTAIERVVDEISNGKWSIQAKIAKDTAAGAVLFTATGSVAIGFWAVMSARPWQIGLFTFRHFAGFILSIGYLCLLWFLRGRAFGSLESLPARVENKN
jgi:undecaprenol kinase